jgi:hypothetical protein
MQVYRVVDKSDLWLMELLCGVGRNRNFFYSVDDAIFESRGDFDDRNKMVLATNSNSGRFTQITTLADRFCYCRSNEIIPGDELEFYSLGEAVRLSGSERITHRG